MGRLPISTACDIHRRYAAANVRTFTRSVVATYQQITCTTANSNDSAHPSCDMINNLVTGKRRERTVGAYFTHKKTKKYQIYLLNTHHI